MSTKLHHGFYVATDDLNRVFEAVDAYRAEVRPRARQIIRAFVVERAVQFADRAALGEIDLDGESPLMRAVQTLFDRQREIEREGKRDPAVDVAVELVFFPTTSPDGRVLGLYFAEREELIEPWLARDLVEPFPYWNNTDHPSEVSLDAWEERRELWSRALEMDGGPGVPSRIGVTAECVSLHQPPPLGEELAAAIPDLETRVRTRARYRVMQARFDELVDAQDEGDPSAFSFTTAAARWLTTDEGRAALEAEIEVVSETLDDELTADDLTSALDGPSASKTS